MKTKDEIREELLKRIDTNGLTLEGICERLLCDHYEHTIDNLLQVLGKLQVPEVRMTWSNDQKEDLLWLFDFCESIDLDSWKLIIFPSLK